MNKAEYMDNLKKGLSGFDKEVREEIINDYEEHFAEGLAIGKSEDEICEELGSVDELVKELGEIGSKKKGFDFSSIEFDKYAEKFAKTLGSIGAAVYRGAGTVAGEVSKDATAFAKMVAKGFEDSMKAAGADKKNEISEEDKE